MSSAGELEERARAVELPMWVATALSEKLDYRCNDCETVFVLRTPKAWGFFGEYC